MEAAYETGEREWLAELLPYIQSNITYTMNFSKNSCQR